MTALDMAFFCFVFVPALPTLVYQTLDSFNVR